MTFLLAYLISNAYNQELINFLKNNIFNLFSQNDVWANFCHLPLEYTYICIVVVITGRL